ncbi:cAMP-binding proteins - catabolite gene activator and regulatory subunit of cAMP-dependent protein kinases [Olavius algarvensis spirochete endosymbiont]|uniref:GGDEF domain-containing protein n=1 Tax=Olavius algarvensis spirochete endosymbiont TaxID=260710 RepID=UPI000F1C34EE|nr:GGDEF domain-containing protein [Olavius algarvensis spirochete endosymbiont]VDB00619.1 cAMP-binding proteins - catabolite gene activator and regulatory subunit of cAMP-dependent protein kinases [Olavius algarvensis spirochete endosymbiont]
MDNRISKLDIFSSLDARELRKIQRFLKELRVPAGETIFREGDEGLLMYVILSGTVSISIKTADGEEVEVSRICEGSFFGEMSILEKTVRSATCRALDSCHMLSLDWKGFRTLMIRQPKASIKVIQHMLNTATSRFLKTGSFLSDMLKWGENARIRAVTDDFTGLYNRRFFDDALVDAVSKANRNDKPVSLIILDLDYFGELNTRYGEAVGDRVILGVVEVFNSTFRKNDILARYGGDEFALVLPNTEGKEALRLCESAVKAIHAMSIFDEHNSSLVEVSASAGIAQCPSHANSPKALLEKSDKALYKAKETGRNRPILFSG